MKKVGIIFFFLITYSLSLIGSNIKKEYKVAIDPKMPPFQFIENGEYKGLNIDLLNIIGERNNIKFKYISMGKERSIKELDKGNIDLILGIRFKEQLGNKMKFSDNILQSTTCMVTLKKNGTRIKNNFGDEAFVVAVEKDSSEYEYLKNLKKINFNVTLDQESLFQLLKMNRADFSIGVKEVAEYLLVSDNEEENYELINSYTAPINYYIGVSLLEDNMLKLINKELKSIKINGEYERLYNKWTKNFEKEKLKKITRMMTRITLFACFLIIIFLISFFWNFQLKNKVKDKTSELLESNKKLEDKIIEIRNTTELNSIICENSPRAIIILNRKGEVNFLNNNTLEMFKLSFDYIGKNIESIPIIKEMVTNDRLDKIINNVENHFTNDLLKIIDGEEYYFRYMIYQLLDYKKNVIGVFLTIEDATKEKLLKERAAEKEKEAAISSMIAGIAHEIRNPLTSIKTYIEILPYKQDNETFKKELVEIVPKEVDRVSKLIENLIDYSKPRSINIEKINIFNLVESCVLLVKPTIFKSNIKLETNIGDNLIIKGDKNQLKQVIINILLNAIDAINDKKSKVEVEEVYNINIKAYRERDKVCLSFFDNGVGLKEKELKNIFHIFYTTKINGTGIGLAVSKQLVEKNNGEIFVESEEGKFTKFIIKFEEV